MPLDNVNFTVAITFSYSREVANGDWPDLTQGENVAEHSLDGIDIDVYDQAFAIKGTIVGGADVTFDLTNLTNLADEDFIFTAVAGLYISATPTVEGDTNCDLSIAPGASNGLPWFYNDGSTILPYDNLTKSFDPVNGIAVAVTPTEKTITLSNSGGDDIDYVLVILGSTA